MRLVIACRAIDNMAGGVERQALALANEMSKRGHEVYLFTLDSAEAKAFYGIEAAVKWHKLDMGNPGQRASWSLRLKRMLAVRKMMRDLRPDVCLAFQDGMFVALRAYTAGMGIQVVAAERESPFRFDFINAGKYRYLIYQAMRFAPHITVQCESYPTAYPKWLQPKITVIPNAIAQHEDVVRPEERQQNPKILLCVGRLGYQKNQLLLTKAFSRLSPIFPDWKLVFVGEGEGRTDLEAEISNCGLSDKIDLVGAVKDVSRWYLKSEVLCLPSRWEGFPNVVGEALAHGLPVVGFQGCGGVRDLVDSNENGLLAMGNENPDSLFKALKDIMSDDDKRDRLRRNAKFSVQEYSPEKVYNQWEKFLNEVSSK